MFTVKEIPMKTKWIYEVISIGNVYKREVDIEEHNVYYGNTLKEAMMNYINKMNNYCYRFPDNKDIWLRNINWAERNLKEMEK